MNDTEPSVTADPTMRYEPTHRTFQVGGVRVTAPVGPPVLAEEVTLSDVDRAYHEWLRARRAVLDAEVTAYRAEVRYKAASRAANRAAAEADEGEPF